MDLENKSLNEFTQLIASKSPYPGGGGASAAVAAIGVALGDMVGELTVGKKKYAEVETEVKALMNKAQALRLRFLRLISEDAEGFDPLSKAYSIPKDDPSRDEELERCLRLAAKAPAEIVDLCCEALVLFKGFAEKGSRLAVSDAATGAAFCRCALYGAAINVYANTTLMKDKTFAAELEAHVDECLEKYLPFADELCKNTVERMRG